MNHRIQFIFLSNSSMSRIYGRYSHRHSTLARTILYLANLNKSNTVYYLIPNRIARGSAISRSMKWRSCSSSHIQSLARQYCVGANNRTMVVLVFIDVISFNSKWFDNNNFRNKMIRIYHQRHRRWWGWKKNWSKKQNKMHTFHITCLKVNPSKVTGIIK